MLNIESRALDVYISRDCLLERQIKLLLREQPALFQNLFSSNDLLISESINVVWSKTECYTSFRFVLCSDTLSGLDHILEKKNNYIHICLYKRPHLSILSQTRSSVFFCFFLVASVS